MAFASSVRKVLTLLFRRFSVEELCQERLAGAERAMNKKDKASRDRQKFVGIDQTTGRIDNLVAEKWSKRGKLLQRI